MCACGIYRIRNVVNGKVYIGQSANLAIRIRNHFVYLRGGYHKNLHLQLSYKKYGEENFESCFLEETYEDMLDIRERAWIRYYKSDQPKFGYNLETGGNLNKHLSEETRRRLSESHKGEKHQFWGKNLAEAHCRHISEAQKGLKGNNFGKHPSEETLLKMSAIMSGTNHPFYGKPKSEEVRRKLSESNKKTWLAKWIELQFKKAQ